MLPENYYEQQRERSRLNYHRNKEQYREKYQERRDRCVVYMKRYNKEYYQGNREDILERNKEQSLRDGDEKECAAQDEGRLHTCSRACHS